jgi:RNA-directed DNA polymerase
LLANIYLHAFDRGMAKHDLGVLVRYADDFVIMCKTSARAEVALNQARQIITGLGLELHPDKTRIIDLREGREGFDFLGCHFHARMSGRLWEQQRIVRYYLHRWPSQQAMKRLREKVRDRTGANRKGWPVEWIIADLNPILRGWGKSRLRRLQVKKRGRNLKPGQARQWTEDLFNELGLHRLRGTIRYPKAA